MPHPDTLTMKSADRQIASRLADDALGYLSHEVATLPPDQAEALVRAEVRNHHTIQVWWHAGPGKPGWASCIMEVDGRAGQRVWDSLRDHGVAPGPRAAIEAPEKILDAAAEIAAYRLRAGVVV